MSLGAIHGAKVNDVVLAGVAGGARELLRSRGELAPGLRLRAEVRVSVEHSRLLGRYGASAADARAREAHRRLSAGDRL